MFEGFEQINFNEGGMIPIDKAQSSSWKNFSKKLLSSSIDFSEQNIRKV
jgi:hypothetical protein